MKTLSNYILAPSGELYHYGVKGMKWGIRRYQNSDGTLTAAGRKRARQEYREDNKTAYELGKSATVTGHAAAKSMKRTIRIENRLDKQYEKDFDGVKGRTKRLRKLWNASAETTAQLAEQYTKLKTKAESHCKELIDKYGQEAVSSIKYKDVKLPKGEYSPSSFKTMNERTNNLSDYARTGGITLTSAAFSMVMGLPVSIVAVPSSTSTKATRLENTTYAANWQKQRNGG